MTWPSSCEVNCDISVLTKYRVVYNNGYKALLQLANLPHVV